ncbi:MAG: FAD-dependent oxidoreductase [Verrucomicrobiota bacterium]
MARIAVLGAGISGLVAARDLVSKGHAVVLFEKSRSLAGRCATRRWLGHVVDHGAQYFTVTSDEFREELEQLPQDFIQCIDGEVISDRGRVLPASGGKRYYCVTGNNRVGKMLAANLEVRLESKITQIDATTDGWQVQEQSFDVVLFTLPWPQTADLLSLDSSAPAYIPCLTAFFEFDGLPAGMAAERYALSLRDPAEPLAWSACENYKQGRIAGNKTVFVVQASEEFSRRWIESDPDKYVPILKTGLKDAWKLSANPTAVFSHRWLYARKANPVDLPTLAPGLFVAGDSCVDSKIEQVWLDGKRAAQEISAYIEKL